MEIGNKTEVGMYRLISNNCTVAAYESLQTAGVTDDYQGLLFSFAPDMLYGNLVLLQKYENIRSLFDKEYQPLVQQIEKIKNE